MAFNKTSIDARTKAELTWIFASRGWIVIRVLSIVLDRINRIVSSYPRITWYMLSNARERCIRRFILAKNNVVSTLSVFKK